VSSLEQSAEKIIKDYVNLFRKDYISATDISKAAYNYEVGLNDGKNNLKLQVYFGKKGNKVVLQGNKESEFYQKVKEIVFGPELFKADTNELTEPESYIGTDESGKGDYFGPLIIAGVFVNKNTQNSLRKAGVRDSKEINSDYSIKAVSSEIKKIVGNNYNLVIISPEKYNKLYESFKNVNKLLGWAHARVLENILKEQEAPEAISDKFGDESYIKNSLQEKGKSILLHQITKAERYTAVAAASILARDKFNDWFEKISKELNFRIPKGASVEVEKAAKRLKAIYGEEFLHKYVKLHFKTSKKIL
jgi:ribonuclease HIII